jgi:hypothetical protein
MKYSANAIIDFIRKPENGFKIDGGVPKCPKEDDCLDNKGDCSYSAGCHQTVRFFQEKSERCHYGYFRLNFTFPLHKRVDSDGYIEESNGSLSFLVGRNIISQDALVAV